ncbi:LOW QUALITY PROTEIN: trafficking protein particle complex subunit 10-like [Uloborus diversus]|uniref:LOW QUALITY PROTEIN: trafficking protein particle complex subunit 10-like n=1 Tax=Uloborus diversus TaxID=327109 RepID=UPI00240A9219|nr:LOW QUALITY PROTEIN: trafficking protein particle complex subunit 10-like [Uloborus diversus]
MDSKPLITCAGDQKLFQSVKQPLTDGLPRESGEWRRSHMRNPKSVYVSANFVEFSEDGLPDEGTTSLLGQAFFHIYWTECQDMDHYKQSVKDSIGSWLSKLKAKKIYDWLIVVVDHLESKKSSKTKLLPRTTVLDKMKSDFPSQSSQRCISLLDPARQDPRFGDSLRAVVERVRRLVLQAWGRRVAAFEEHVRGRRERRTEPGWSFANFFGLQEELALALEALGLYDEALVQYDELDALFTQFVINSNVGDMPSWMSAYSGPCDVWPGLCLLPARIQSLRRTLSQGRASLLDLRCYLFARQCSLLLMLCRPWEVAQRTLPFLHNCVSELRTLEVSVPPGAVSCWVFLSCFEVLRTCEKFSDQSQIKEYSLYCAGLWAYAREKLHDLGLLCGLMPDLEANSEKLHIVVGLLAGMGEDPYSESSVESPHAKLRAALSSKDTYLKHYLELSELTMGTFKHNRRIRTARLIGRDLAQFYMKMKQPQKAVSFLSDLLKTYREENWEVLTADIQQDLLACYTAMEDTPRLLKTLVRLSATLHTPLDRRKDYFQEITTHSEKLGTEPLLLRTEKTFLLGGATIDSPVTPIIRNSEIRVTFTIQSNLPSEIICRNVRLVLKRVSSSGEGPKKSEGRRLSPRSHPSGPAHSPMSPMLSGELGIPCRDDMPPRILVQPQVVLTSYRQDGQPIFSVVCKNTHQVLRRRDSLGFHKEDITEEEVGPTFKSSMVKLTPGHNVVTITVQTSEAGLFSFHRLWLEWGNIHFAVCNFSPVFSFVVVEEAPTLHIEPREGDLLAGIERTLLLNISSGSSCFSTETSIQVKASRGLRLKVGSDDWSEEVTVWAPPLKPFERAQVELGALASLGPQRNANTIEHTLALQCPWAQNAQRIQLHFQAPFLVTQKLHTSGIRKYIQVTINGMSRKRFLFRDVQLTPMDKPNVPLKELCAFKELVVDSDQSTSFLWEILSEEPELLPLQFDFSATYNIQDFPDLGPYPYQFELKLNSYETLYAIRSRVEPPRGSEFCRAGTTCFMHVTIHQVHPSGFTSLMYEVVADQATWAVCGRTAGVVNIDTSGRHSVVLDVMPLLAGFLPLPAIRLSKYIPAEKPPAPKESTPSKDASYHMARLEPFDAGQVYSWSRATQVHVLPAPTTALDVSS